MTASSTFLNIFPGSNAVDGNADNDFYGGKSCMMTNKDKHPFLRIDLGGPYIVYEVRYSRFVYLTPAIKLIV